VLFESHNKYVVSLKLLRLCVLDGEDKKGNVVPVEAMKVYGGVILTAALLNLDASWRVVFRVTPRPLYPNQNRCPFSRWPYGTHCRPGFCRRKESYIPGRIRAPDRETALSRLLMFCVTD